MFNIEDLMNHPFRMSPEPAAPQEPIKATPEPENPWVARIMRLPDNDAMTLCCQFGVSPQDTKYLTAKTTVERVSSWGIDEVKSEFLKRLEHYEKKAAKTPPQEESVKVKVIQGNSLSEILDQLFGMMTPLKKKRVKVEYETELYSTPERMKQILEEQSKLVGCPVYNVSVTEVK